MNEEEEERGFERASERVDGRTDSWGWLDRQMIPLDRGLEQANERGGMNITY